MIILRPSRPFVICALCALCALLLLGATGCFLRGGTSSTTRVTPERESASALPESETSRLAVLIEQGNTALVNGELNEATRLYREAESLAPDNPFVKNNLGLVNMEREYYSLAASNFREAIELLPYYYKAHNNLGNCYYLLEYYDLSRRSYEEALRIKPDYALAHWNMAMLLEKMGNHLDAIRHWQRYIALAEGEGDVAFARDRISALRDLSSRGAGGVDPDELEMGYDY